MIPEFQTPNMSEVEAKISPAGDKQANQTSSKPTSFPTTLKNKNLLRIPSLYDRRASVQTIESCNSNAELSVTTDHEENGKEENKFLETEKSESVSYEAYQNSRVLHEGDESTISSPNLSELDHDADLVPTRLTEKTKPVELSESVAESTFSSIAEILSPAEINQQIKQDLLDTKKSLENDQENNKSVKTIDLLKTQKDPIDLTFTDSSNSSFSGNPGQYQDIDQSSEVIPQNQTYDSDFEPVQADQIGDITLDQSYNFLKSKLTQSLNDTHLEQQTCHLAKSVPMNFVPMMRDSLEIETPKEENNESSAIQVQFSHTLNEETEFDETIEADQTSAFGIGRGWNLGEMSGEFTRNSISRTCKNTKI